MTPPAAAPPPPSGAPPPIAPRPDPVLVATAMARVGATIAANTALVCAGAFLVARRFVRLDSGDLHLLALVLVVAVPLTVGTAAAVRTRRRIVRWARYQAGRCPQCGYDLCATPARCPECGRTPWKPPRPDIWKSP